MHQIYPDDGLIMFLERMVADDLQFHLFVNNVTPDRSFNIASFTEASFGGYPAGGILVAAADFVLSGVAGNVGTKLAAPIAFPNTSGSSQNAFGYYVTDTGVTKLLFAARFDSAPVAKASGDSFLVVPTISDLSQFAT